MAGKVITPKQFAMQWLTLPNKFEVNIFNFETIAGNVAKKVFKDSFYLRRFNTTGASAWPARYRKYGAKSYAIHPLLNETGSLKDSIIWRRDTGNGLRSVVVYTNPAAFKGEKRNKHGKCYAAIHNEGGSVATPGSPASYIRQRQFIGYSTVLADDMKSYCIRIFDGFPK